MMWKDLIYKFRGELLGILSGLLWAINLILIDRVASLYKELSDDYLFLSVIILLFTEFFSLVFLSFLRIRKITLDISKNAFVIRKNIIFLVFPSIGMGLYILSIVFSGVAITTYFTSIYPIFSLLILFFLYRKINFKVVISIILSVIGLYLTIEPLEINNLQVFGIFFALLCAFSWGSESVCCEYFSIKSIFPETILFFRYIISICISIILCLIFFYLGGNFSINIEFLFNLFIVSIFSVLSYFFYYTSISIIGSSYAINFNISYILWVMLFLFTTYNFTIISIIGGFCIFCSIVISFSKGEK
ncbi:DMT family transporter [Gallibacterium genomosp. 1]|uniref:DMT family transporter n=1 Tax=Gallibacterium genomosp. 1 TaxID=155515 RepID=UPI0008028495|nr:DMT family transporter [Gallibacterium genomosp. 1]OBW97845.1 hypothetical protein QV04_10245 [Gallibacterium genomosp. 1]